MASATSRRAVATAALATLATIGGSITGLVLNGTASAAVTKLGAPTMSPADGSTAAANRPTVNATFASGSTLNQSSSTISVVDTSNSNAPVACDTVFPSANVIQCNLKQDLIDTHAYKVSVHGVDAADSTDVSDATASFTDDIPSVVSQSPKDGDVVGSGSTTIKATYDEALDPSSLITVTNANGNQQAGGSLSASSPVPGSAKDTISFTPNLPNGTFHVHIHAVASGKTSSSGPNADFANTDFSYTVNATLPPAAPTVTTHGFQGPGDANSWINSNNQSAVPFAGTAPANFRVEVIVYDAPSDLAGINAGTCDYGSCPNDGESDVAVPDCGQPTCPWSLTVDMSGASHVTNYWAAAYSAAGAKGINGTTAPGTATDPAMMKDTSTPAPPSGSGTAAFSTPGNPNLLTVSDSSRDTTVVYWQVTVTDVEKHAVKSAIIPAPQSPLGGSSFTTNLDVSSLDDDAPGSAAVGLNVDVEALNRAGGSAQDVVLASVGDVKKETVPIAADYANSFVSVGGTKVPFSSLNNSATRTPTSVTVMFNELIRATADDSNGKHLASTTLCLADNSGFCVPGTVALTKDNMGFVFTLTGTPTDAGSPYTIRGVVGVAATVPNSNSNLTGLEIYRSATSADPVVTFNIDNSSPKTPTVSVTPSPTIDGSTDTNGKPNAQDVTIAGTAEAGDNVTIKVKSSGGGPLFIANGGKPVNADANGAWSLTGQNLSTLADGLLTVTATAADAAGNTSAVGTPSTAPTLAARPSPPQHLAASVNPTQVTLSWDAPASNGGSALTGYTLTYTDTTAATAPQTANPSASPYTVSGLTTGDTYQFSLCGTNSVGGPCNSATITAVPTNASVLTALTSRSTISYGTRVTLSGRLTDKSTGIGLASKPVTVTPIYQNGSQGTVIHLTTSSAGGWSAAFTPAKTAFYRAAFAGDKSNASASALVRVFVRERVFMGETSRSSSHTAAVTISGSVRPAQPGRVVYVYERTSRGNKLVGRARLSSKSTYALSHVFSRGTHTIFAEFFAQNGNASGVSRPVRFTRS